MQRGGRIASDLFEGRIFDSIEAGLEYVEGVGFGWLNLHRTDRSEPVLRFEDWPETDRLAFSGGFSDKTASGIGFDLSATLERSETSRRIGPALAAPSSGRRTSMVSPPS